MNPKTPETPAKSGNINVSINADSFKKIGAVLSRLLGRYATILIFIVLTVLYAYVITRINTLSNPVVTEADVQGGSQKLSVPKIDEEAAAKLQSLKDNSVNVQTLFEQNRENPFD